MRKKITKTDACRWLSEHACDLPEMEPFFALYMAGVQQQLKFGERFGYWLKDKHRTIFKKWYRTWWKKHSDLRDQVYDECEAATAPIAEVVPDFMIPKNNPLTPPGRKK